MKMKVMHITLYLVWAALLIISLLHPHSIATPIVVGIAVVYCVLFWWAAVLVLCTWLIDGRGDDVLVTLMKLRVRSSRNVRFWVLTSHTILCLAHSGWFITMAAYCLTLLIGLFFLEWIHKARVLNAHAI